MNELLNLLSTVANVVHHAQWTTIAEISRLNEGRVEYLVTIRDAIAGFNHLATIFPS